MIELAMMGIAVPVGTLLMVAYVEGVDGPLNGRDAILYGKLRPFSILAVGLSVSVTIACIVVSRNICTNGEIAVLARYLVFLQMIIYVAALLYVLVQFRLRKFEDTKAHGLDKRLAVWRNMCFAIILLCLASIVFLVVRIDSACNI